MKTSKRILAALFAALTLFFLTACASRQSQTAAPAQTAQQPSQQETPAQNTDSNADAETPETPAQTEGPDTAEPADKQSEETSPEGGERLSSTTLPAAIPRPSRAISRTRWVRTRLSLCRRHRIPRMTSTGP